jgi:hypothetical protein
MIDTQFDFKICKDHDVDTYKKDFDKVDKIRLDMKNNKLSTLKFEELFERLSATKIEYFQLDISNFDKINSEMFEAIIKCIRTWNLKTLILQISGINISDSQFESLIFESLRTMTNLQNLYLDMERVGWNKNKNRSIERLIPQLESLNNIFLNVKNNNLTKDEIEGISKMIKHIPSREFIL